MMPSNSEGSRCLALLLAEKYDQARIIPARENDEKSIVVLK
jgi:hypothetical protein